MTDTSTTLSGGDEEYPKSAPVDREINGPLDETEAGSIRPSVDLGALRIEPKRGMQLRLEIDKNNNRVIAVTLEHDGSTVQLQPFAAPRSSGLWHGIRAQIMEQVRKQGGTVSETEGPFGPRGFGKSPCSDWRVFWDPQCAVYRSRWTSMVPASRHWRPRSNKSRSCRHHSLHDPPCCGGSWEYPSTPERPTSTSCATHRGDTRCGGCVVVVEPLPDKAGKGPLRGSGLGALTPGETPTVDALWSAVGKTRGLVESLAPGLGFLITFTLTGELVPSVTAPVALSVVFIIVRLLQKTALMPAVAGLIGIGASAGIALWSGRAEDNFLLGFGANVLWLIALLISLLIRRPLLGYLAGSLAGDPQWRDQPGTKHIAGVATWLWAGLFALRLAVQVPLYLAASISALAAAKLIMGLPLYAAWLWVTWLLYRAVYGSKASRAR
jgi:hypothetical protein